MLVRKFESNPSIKPIQAWLQLYLTPERYHFFIFFNPLECILKDTLTAKTSGVLLCLVINNLSEMTNTNDLFIWILPCGVWCCYLERHSIRFSFILLLQACQLQIQVVHWRLNWLPFQLQAVQLTTMETLLWTRRQLR